jgi:hypothetical protein
LEVLNKFAVGSLQKRKTVGNWQLAIGKGKQFAVCRFPSLFFLFCKLPTAHCQLTSHLQ